MPKNSLPKDIILTMSDTDIVNFINDGKMDEWIKNKREKEKQKLINILKVKEQISHKIH